MRYVALLRGINVGGNNKIAMAELTALFEASGMTGVRSYINSGNVIFSSPIEDPRRLAGVLEKAIRERFGFQVNVLVKDSEMMRSIIDAVPAAWANDRSTRCDVLYLWEDVDRPSILDELDFRPEIETVSYTPGAVIWRIDKKNVTRSRLSKIVGTPLYKRMTIRNLNTAKKLAELMRE